MKIPKSDVTQTEQRTILNVASVTDIPNKSMAACTPSPPRFFGDTGLNLRRALGEVKRDKKARFNAEKKNETGRGEMERKRRRARGKGGDVKEKRNVGGKNGGRVSEE